MIHTLLQYKKILLGGLVIVGFFLVIVYNGRIHIAITGNVQSSNNQQGEPTLLNRLTGGILQGYPEKELLDPARELFLTKNTQASEEKKRNILRYVNQANSAIPLTTEALQFTLIEVVMGEYEPLQDTVKRLEEGKRSIQLIEPPIDALAFHHMSIALMEEYGKILTLPLTIPREEFDYTQLEDDFDRLNGLVTLAKRELQLLSNTYGIPLFSNVIRFYDEAIGVQER